jgi:Ser/Thr protein kinase RdoA (MazF antagonist)
MSNPFPVTHSIPSASALREVIAAEYGLAAPSECLFFLMGVNDTYLVKTTTTTYILRVYRCGWRAPPFLLAFPPPYIPHFKRPNSNPSQGCAMIESAPW